MDPGGEGNVMLIHPDDAARHGWGSRILAPHKGSAPQSVGVNRNLLVDAEPVDPLSQTPTTSSTYVAVARAGH
ncbi:hypothetical protein [Mycobacterium angelicum]|uniref:Molybdopterin dinucleotide-binding domain-containing protein n=1 Tax=Mycobacterium angelicum TaxID=470074 RepID=A0A1W9ZVW1_MYCAN|nr:hypothetical protein [Mycobacterium angelicum]MCV7200247.1 hypothetical protein [Mycobacterium angelicum]ORA21666.1 hypothetical protein BST12_11410 [Mycobacterium angelicum]